MSQKDWREEEEEEKKRELNQSEIDSSSIPNTEYYLFIYLYIQVV